MNVVWMVLCFLTLNGLPTQAKQKVAPLKTDLKLTASFAEYRGSHFHGGADFSTQRITGHPVRAMATGVVLRLKHQPRGSGRAVYLRHADQTISMYAHLEDYAQAIQKLLPEQRHFDFFPQHRVRIKAGDVLGYSGESGAGLPHLHVEWRNADNQPMAAIMNAFDVELDTRSPVLEAIHIQSFPAALQNRRIPASELSSTAHAVATGPVGLAVEVWDPSNRSGARLGIRELRLLTEEGSVLYEAHFDHIDYRQRVPTGLHLDRRWTRLGGPTRYVYYLYQNAVQRSSYIQESTDHGRLIEGEHDLVVEVVDFFSNSIRRNFSLKVGPGQSGLQPYSGPSVLRQGSWRVKVSETAMGSHQKLTLMASQDGVRLLPKEHYFLSSVRMTYAQTVPADQYLAFCYQGHCKASGRRRNNGHWRSWIHRGGHYRFLQDRDSPFIAGKLLQIKGLRKSRQLLKVFDSQSGLNTHKLELRCNQKPVLAVYDADRGGVEIPRKCQQIYLKACDRNANCSQRKLTGL